MRPGQLIVRGSLDKEIVRRVVRRHINEVKYCYEQELAKDSSRSGRVVVQFTVAPSGQVLASVLQSSTLGSPRVEVCIVNAIKRWEFPKPDGGGIVIVSYPFELRPGDLLPDTSRARRMAPEPPAPAPTPTTPIDEALATLAGGASAEHIERISSLLGLRRISSAEVLAWTIDRRAGGLETKLLVARLLELTRHHGDAVRVLSEAARANSHTIAAELRRIGANADADEVLALAKR